MLDDEQMQAQMAIQEEKNPRVYKIVKEISSPKKYIFDMSYVGNGKISLSLDDDSYRSWYPGTYVPQYSVLQNGDIEHLSYNGLYSLYWKFLSEGFFLFTFQKSVKYIYFNSNYPNSKLNVSEFLPDPNYFVHGMAVCKPCINRNIVVSLWNGKFQEKSQGKILKFEKCIASNNFQQVCNFENDKHIILFTFPTHLTVNGNTDICVSDSGSVVVIDEKGVLRFRYRGLSQDPHFEPYGICSDSECNIIVADMKNDKIHMIDQNGGFICFLYYEDMKMPRALCIDENDNLYVSEWKNERIKIISSQ
ncbi:uncharacterized protein LOC134256355 [Saccostrea cucullata]|uniref:uncharacterized protein LOC134256355 n=1 Tax=Saccostrea cuccullata TaxID=36930 RepID=UPI002ED21C87